MKLYKLQIEGFRKIRNAEVNFGDATFLIGENNVGKSTVLAALKYLLSNEKKLKDFDYSQHINETGHQIVDSDKVVFTAEFRNVPIEIVNERGFNKQRLITYQPTDQNDSGLSFIYRKTYSKNEDVVIEMKLHSQTKKARYNDCTTPESYVNAGASVEIMKEIFGEENYTKRITEKNQVKLYDISELWDINPDSQEWVQNPGGIPGNVLSKLPKFLLIPAEDKTSEMGVDGKNGTMISILQELFKEVREQSDNYKKAQEYLNKLAEELDPTDEEKEIGKMMKGLNTVINDVFPSAHINATANLNDPDSVLKPIFDITMSSNVSTPINYQGTGMIRAAVFSLLRFCKQWEDRRNDGFKRGIIIGFEEPEIYLHPNAANKMRNTIYELATQHSQIVCTTHSPYMIDLSKKPRQVLNSFTINSNFFVDIVPFNISGEFTQLQADDQGYIKMLQKMDDYLSRVFFAKRVIIVEGDTEDVVLKSTIELMPSDSKNRITSDFEIVKARGKAAIISLVKYLRAMGIRPFVIHDRDQETPGATRFNQPILEALNGDANSRLMMAECIENELGYSTPSSDKPFKAFQFVQRWTSWDNVPQGWKDKMKIVFRGYID
ncbi:MAG: ATP-dependent endonuclease [Bacteroidales bacterium]|nr:ATP-dependent endonuclease [Bacteroidales bacterium]